MHKITNDLSQQLTSFGYDVADNPVNFSLLLVQTPKSFSSLLCSRGTFTLSLVMVYVIMTKVYNFALCTIKLQISKHKQFLIVINRGIP